MEIGHGIRDLTEASRISRGSDSSKTENVEVQVAVDLLLQARDPTVNSKNVGLRTKKTVDDSIKRVVEPLDLVAKEKGQFCDRVPDKVYFGLLSFFLCVVSVSAVLRDAMTGMHFPDTIRPT